MITLFSRHQEFVSVDPYASYVTLLAPFSGVNGSTTFVDQTGLSTFTTVGSPSISTTQNSAGALSLNGSSALYLTSNASTFSFSSNDFTIECSFYLTSYGTNPVFVQSDNTTSTRSFVLLLGASNKLEFAWSLTGSGSFNAYVAPGSAPSLNTWYSVAAVRKSSTIYLFSNGTLLGSSSITGSLFGVSDAQIGYCSEGGPGQFVSGYMNNVRITNGFGRYTTSYTPSPFLPL